MFNFFSKKFKVMDFPPPYVGMLAINSDVEYTLWDTQLSLLELMGKLGLETAFSYWCYGDPECTWNFLNEKGQLRDSYGKQAIYLARYGLLDTLHSFAGIEDGKGTHLSRKKIDLAFQFLNDNGIKTKVYTNHGGQKDIQNIGGEWASYQEGDLPSSDSYHLDLSLNYGIRFFWTDIDYDNENRSFSIMDNKNNPHLFTVQQCRDSNYILRFKRYRGPFKKAPSLSSFIDQIRPFVDLPHTDYSIIYQHLGTWRDKNENPVNALSLNFSEEDQRILHEFSLLHHNKKQFITTTSKLLNYALIMTIKPWKMIEEKNKLIIIFEEVHNYKNMKVAFSQEDFCGFTLKIDPKLEVEATYKNQKVEFKRFNIEGKTYVQVPWNTIDISKHIEYARSLR